MKHRLPGSSSWLIACLLVVVGCAAAAAFPAGEIGGSIRNVRGFDRVELSVPESSS